MVLRLAYVINSVEGGGAALPVPAVVRALRNCGAEIRLFALTRRDGRAVPAMEQAQLQPAVRCGGESDHFEALAWLDQEMAHFRPDMMWTSLTRATLLGQLVGKRRGIPVVSWQHAAYLRPANRRLLRITRGLTALWVGDSASVTEFAHRRLKIPRSRLATWPIFAADSAAPQARAWIPGEGLRIGALGRLHPVKGFDVLIGALARLRDTAAATGTTYQVTIAGEGQERARLQGEIDSAGLPNVHLAGFVEHSGKFLADQHLYLQPSRSEGFCVAAHEAMQAGLPIVASAVGEIANSVEDGVTGHLVPPGDVLALSEVLRACIERPTSLHAMGTLSRDRLLTRFSAEQFQRNADAVYARLAALCRPSRSPDRSVNDRPV